MMMKTIIAFTSQLGVSRKSKRMKNHTVYFVLSIQRQSKKSIVKSRWSTLSMTHENVLQKNTIETTVAGDTFSTCTDGCVCSGTFFVC